MPMCLGGKCDGVFLGYFRAAKGRIRRQEDSYVSNFIFEKLELPDCDALAFGCNGIYKFKINLHRQFDWCCSV